MKRGEDIPSGIDTRSVLIDAELQTSRGNNVFKKTTGKVSDYWLFVQAEGRKMFSDRHKRYFDCKVKADEELMGYLWHGLAPEKRASYKLKAQERNTPEQVKQRRNVEAARARASHQNAGVLGYETRILRAQQLDIEVQHRLATHAATDSDLSSFGAQAPLFYYGEAMKMFSQKEQESNYQKLIINFVDKKGDALTGVLRNQTFAIIKCSIYDSVFVSAAFKARTHPSELSIVIFNQEQGIFKTKTWVYKMEPQLLYGTSGIPEENFNQVQQQELKTNILSSSKKERKHETSIYEGFQPILDVIGEYKAQILISRKDWNHVMSSLFFLAHAAQNEKEFKNIRVNISLLEEVLISRDLYYTKKLGPGSDFKPYNRERLEETIADNKMIEERQSRIYICEHHLPMSDNYRINCCLSRAAVVVHNIFAMWMDTRFAGWTADSKNSRFSFAVPLPSTLQVVDPEAIIEPVITQYAEMKVRDHENERNASEDEEDSNPEEEIFHNKHRDDAIDNIRNNRNRAQQEYMRRPSPPRSTANSRAYTDRNVHSPACSRCSPPIQQPRRPDSSYDEQADCESSRGACYGSYRYDEHRENLRYSPPNQRHSPPHQRHSPPLHNHHNRQYYETPLPEASYHPRLPSYQEALQAVRIPVTRAAMEPNYIPSSGYSDPHEARFYSEPNRYDDSRRMDNYEVNNQYQNYQSSASPRYGSQSRPPPRMGSSYNNASQREQRVRPQENQETRRYHDPNKYVLEFSVLTKEEYHDFLKHKRKILMEQLRTNSTLPHAKKNKNLYSFTFEGKTD